MTRVKTFGYYATVPVNILLILWVWFGRGFFGSYGWMMVFFTFTVVPVMVVALTITTVLAIRQRLPARAGFLTAGQFWSLTVMWLSLLLFGGFVVDGGDTDYSSSAFTEVVGASALGLSNRLTGHCFSIAAAAYVVLLVQLILGQRGRQERRGGQRTTLPDPPVLMTPGDAPGWGPPRTS